MFLHNLVDQLTLSVCNTTITLMIFQCGKMIREDTNQVESNKEYKEIRKKSSAGSAQI